MELVPMAGADVTAAIERALEDICDGHHHLPEAYRSRWRRAALEEGIGSEVEESAYPASPRSRRGAERA
jgi:hypothetical protein